MQEPTFKEFLVDVDIFTVFYVKIFVSSVDPGQVTCFVMSELGLHCVHNAPKWLSGLKCGCPILGMFIMFI